MLDVGRVGAGGWRCAGAAVGLACCAPAARPRPLLEAGKVGSWTPERQLRVVDTTTPLRRMTLCRCWSATPAVRTARWSAWRTGVGWATPVWLLRSRSRCLLRHHLNVDPLVQWTSTLLVLRRIRAQLPWLDRWLRLRTMVAFLFAEVLVTDEISVVGVSSRAKALPDLVGADDDDDLFRHSLLGGVVVCLSPPPWIRVKILVRHVDLGDDDALASFPS